MYSQPTIMKQEKFVYQIQCKIFGPPILFQKYDRSESGRHQQNFERTFGRFCFYILVFSSRILLDLAGVLQYSTLKFCYRTLQEDFAMCPSVIDYEIVRPSTNRAASNTIKKTRLAND